MERGAPRTPLRFGRGAVKKWPTTPSFFWPLPPSRSGHGARCPADGPVSRADHPRRVCRHLPAGLPTLPGSKSVLAAPGTPPPRGRELRPRRAGNSPWPTVHSGRSCRARATDHLLYSLAGFSILPDSEPVLAAPGASSPRGREPRPRRAGNSPWPTVHSGRSCRARTTGHLLYSPADSSILPDSEPVLAAPGASSPRGRGPRPNRAGNSPWPTVHSGRSCRARAAGRLRYSPAGFSILPDSELVLAISGASPSFRQTTVRPEQTQNSPRPAICRRGPCRIRATGHLLPCQFTRPAWRQTDPGWPRGAASARAGDAQAGVTLKFLLGQSPAAADLADPCQLALCSPARGLKRGPPVLLPLPPVYHSRRAPERGRWQGASRRHSSPADRPESRVTSVKALAFSPFCRKKGAPPGGREGLLSVFGVLFYLVAREVSVAIRWAPK